ncbi:MAG: 4Fe-4S binding protein [candidate division WS1 bacterium]|nr:4Fe-4S binding protein [candidate division WS1 bacterium]
MRRPQAPRLAVWRTQVQAISTVVLNSYFLKSWTGGLCVPVLNCWSCPSAIGSCPLGAMQHYAGQARSALSQASFWSLLPLYPLGLMLACAVLGGRLMCGWLCPFGWLQDLLGKLQRRKLRLPAWTGHLRYVFLVGLVFVVPYYTARQAFSEICPMGALQGGWFQPLLYPELRAGMQELWWAKQAVLLAWLAAFLFVRRPFCRLMCPLGALFSLFYGTALWQIRLNPYKCNDCGWCEAICPAGLDPRREVGSPLCISCLECQGCPQGAIVSGPVWKLGTAPPLPEEGNSR